MVFSQYVRDPESKSLAPDGTPCKADTQGLLKRYPIKASEFHLIGKETERGRGQAEDISTLLPLLVHYYDYHWSVRRMSASSRQRIVAAQKARWARWRKQQKSAKLGQQSCSCSREFTCLLGRRGYDRAQFWPSPASLGCDFLGEGHT